MALLYPGLPREIRDCIYEYVLTDLVGLSYRVGDDKISRICESTNGDLLPVVPMVRNRITLLSSICGTIGAMFSRSHNNKQGESFNQIQYVSRAFHAETAGLEFKFNSIQFTDCGGFSAGQRCRTFVNGVESRSYAKHLKLRIIGACPLSQWKLKEQALTLLEYCAQNPNSTVRWHDPQWSLEDPKFILIGLAYITAFRGDRDILARLMHSLDPLLQFDLSSYSLTLPNEVPRNYRILPAERHLSRTSFMIAYKRSCALDGTDISQWSNLVEHWFNEGI
jgi:hypothetical protein